MYRRKISWFSIITVILFFVAGSVFLLMGSISYIINKSATDGCTAVTYGVVVKVDRVLDKSREGIATSRGLKLYRKVAKVEPEDKSIFNNSTLTSYKSDHSYEKGERVEIHYDPSNPYSYYIQYANPTTDGFLFILYGAILSFFGIVALVVHKKRS